MTNIIDGKKIAAEKEAKLTKEVAAFVAKYKVTPKLVAVMVGSNPASVLYVAKKEEAAKRVGIAFEKKVFGEKEKLQDICKYLETLSNDSSVHGIMVQLPLPGKLEQEDSKLKIITCIAPLKDVDGLTPQNLGLVQVGSPFYLPATVRGIMAIIEHLKLNLENSNVTIVGGSDIVGKPLALHLSNLGATVILCRSRTKNLPIFTAQADILVSATGVPGMIIEKMVKRGAVVIDVGSPKGDVDLKRVVEVALAISPVPGGVGPLTVVSLLENTFLAAKRQAA